MDARALFMREYPAAAVTAAYTRMAFIFTAPLLVDVEIIGDFLF